MRLVNLRIYLQIQEQLTKLSLNDEHDQTSASTALLGVKKILVLPLATHSSKASIQKKFLLDPWNYWHNFCLLSKFYWSKTVCIWSVMLQYFYVQQQVLTAKCILTIIIFSIRPSVPSFVMSRYWLKPRWHRDSGFSPYDSLRVSSFLQANFVPLNEETPLEPGH